MESIPLVSSQNSQLHTAMANTDALNATPRPILAQVQTSPEGDSIILNGTEYNLKLVNAQQRQILLTANSFLVTPNAQNSSTPTTIVQNSTSQLLALATPLVLKIPEAVINLAQQNGISQTQLSTLAARTQGYPLPNVTIVNKEFQFANG
ncbi:MAG: flagellar hook-length control protein FliK, partial [Shewanella sp.]